MQKKIIALAIAAALTAPAMAYAEVNVYGQFNLAIDMYDQGEATNSTSANQMNSYGSRIGFKGTDALDGGIALDWQLEGSVAADSGTTSKTTTYALDPIPTPTSVDVTTTKGLFDREANIGLSNDMGTVRLGLQASPYKAMGRKLDLFGDSVADTRGGLGGRVLGNGHDASGPNSVSYKSPSMGGITVVAATGFLNETPAPSGADKASYLGFAGMYEQGPLFAMVAYANNDDGVTGGNSDTATKVGGSYSMDAITVNAVFEAITETAAGTDTKSNNLYLGGKFNLSSTSAVKLAYTNLGEQESTGNGITQLAIGYDHGMSKATTLYALYTAVTQELSGQDEPSVISFGLKHKF